MKDVKDVEDAEDVEDVDVRCPCQCPAAQGGQPWGSILLGVENAADVFENKLHGNDTP